MEKHKEIDYLDLLHYFQLKYPKRIYRFNGRFIQQKSGKNGWKRICNVHGRVATSCTICGGTSICQHRKVRSFCSLCKGGGICIHRKIRARCYDCNGVSTCIHKRQKAQCKECNGSAFCEHKTRYTTCKICCGTSICDHGKLKNVCIICGGSKLCKKCHVKHGINDGYCIKCHPEYIETGKGTSKVSCTCIDELEKHFNCQIEHYHYDLMSKKLVGSEHRPELWPAKPLDGFFRLGENKIAIEFLVIGAFGTNVQKPGKDTCVE